MGQTNGGKYQLSSNIFAYNCMQTQDYYSRCEGNLDE